MVMLYMLYIIGRKVIDSFQKTEKKLNDLINARKKMPDAIALIMHFKDILKQSKLPNDRPENLQEPGSKITY